MRTREGFGKVPPRPERVSVDRSDIAEAKRNARILMKQRGYDLREDQWGQGRFGPARTCLIGKVGEVAFAKWIRARLGIKIELDTEYKWGGDGGIDFEVCGYKVQIKTAVSDYDELLLPTRGISGTADESGLSWDVCFRLQWGARVHESPESLRLFNDSRKKDFSVVELRGLVWPSDFWSIAGLPVRSSCGDWWNYAIKAHNLLPVASFLDKCKARSMRGQREAI